MATKPIQSNATRFIHAYNRLDKGIRDLYNLKPALSFSDVIRKSATVNFVIKKHEDDLIDYGRLRNAIVHRSNDETIAEPHDDVVEKMELIVRLVTTPPMVMQTAVNRSVFMAQGDVKLGTVISEMQKSGFSNIPVYLHDTLVGVINRKMIVDTIGEAVANGKDLKKLMNAKVVESLPVLDTNNHYEVVSEKITIDNVLYMFQQNRKLSTIIITKGGTYKELPIGIVCNADIIDMQTILDNY